MHKNGTPVKAVISSCAMPSFGKSHSLPPAACLSNSKQPFLPLVLWDTHCVMKPWQFSAQKSNVPLKSWIPHGEMGRDLLRRWREETSASRCAHRPLLDQDCSDAAKRQGQGSWVWAAAPGHKVRGASLLLLFPPCSRCAWDGWLGTVFLPYTGGAQRMVDGAFLPTCSAGEKLRGQHGSFMPAFPIRANK